MKIIGIDTNVLLSVRLQRGSQSKKAQSLFEDCLKSKLQIFIPDIIIVETEWVMRSYYKESKGKIIEFLEEILLIKNVLVQDKNLYKIALETFRSTNLDLIDCIIIVQIQNLHPDEFLTFDENLKRFYENSYNLKKNYH